MNIMELVEEILDTLRYMDDAVNVICNLDAKAVVERMEVADVIPIPEEVTNGNMIKALFPNCEDRKARFEEDDGEVYEVHFVHLLDSMVINKFDENWWNAPYKRESDD